DDTLQVANGEIEAAEKIGSSCKWIKIVGCSGEEASVHAATKHDVASEGQRNWCLGDAGWRGGGRGTGVAPRLVRRRRFALDCTACQPDEGSCARCQQITARPDALLCLVAFWSVLHRAHHCIMDEICRRLF